MSTLFSQALHRKRVAISAELTLTRETDADQVHRMSGELAPWVDAISVTDIPYGWVQISALSAAVLLRQGGHECIPVLTCRDRNGHALRSDLNGLYAAGIRNVFLMRGHRLPAAHPVRSEPVLDMTGRKLVSLASEMGGDAEHDGFCIGIGARAFRPVRGWSGESLRERIDRGAGYIQTQLCLNMNLLRHYVKRLAETGITERAPLVVTVSPLPSAETATWMRSHMKDSRIPNPIIEKLENADDPEQEGVRICGRLMRQIASIEEVSGIHVMTTGNAETVRAAIEASGLRE